MSGGDRAFPRPAVNLGQQMDWGEPGITKREYFAGIALQGLLVNIDKINVKEGLAGMTGEHAIATQAFEFADAMVLIGEANR